MLTTIFRRTFGRTPACLNNISRTMSSSTSTQKMEWLIILPDQPNALERRMEVRPTHLENVTKRAGDGFWTFGGALLETVPVEGDPLKISGSAMVALASSKEEVIEELKKDIYAKSGVWDFSKIQIYPFKKAFVKA